MVKGEIKEWKILMGNSKRKLKKKKKREKSRMVKEIICF